jgi:hypothetical protein
MHRQYLFLARPEQGKPACPAGKQVLKRCLYSAMEDINSAMILYRHNNKNNRAAIDVFFAARVAR